MFPVRRVTYVPGLYRRGYVAVEQALTVLGEHRRVPHRVVHVEADEPPEKEVVVELLHQLALAPDRIEDLEQLRPEQLLGRDRRAADLRVQRLEAWRQLDQELVDQRPDRAERVVLQHSRSGRDVAEHRRLLPVVTAHARLLGECYAHRTRPFTMARHPKSGFSAAC